MSRLFAKAAPSGEASKIAQISRVFLDAWCAANPEGGVEASSMMAPFLHSRAQAAVAGTEPRSASPLFPGGRGQGVDRRFVLGGLAAAASFVGARTLRAEGLPPGRTTTSPEGIVRTLLERFEDERGNVFELIHDTFPAGINVPLHHHPATALNYVLSGMAESQYEGEKMLLLKPGDSFQDHANRNHVHFRNPDPHRPVQILITHVLKKDQAFFIPGPV